MTKKLPKMTTFDALGRSFMRVENKRGGRNGDVPLVFYVIVVYHSNRKGNFIDGYKTNHALWDRMLGQLGNNMFIGWV